MDATTTRARDVTRVEVAAAVRGAFGRAGATRAELIDAACRADARAEVVETLGTLPSGGFREVRELWRHLLDLAVR
jgi:hypothetical protein